jgi:long-chain fatty acid transport protein
VKAPLERFTALQLAFAAIIATSSWPSPAGASPLIEFSGGLLGTGGFNARAGGASAASAYFNPALLPQAEQGLELGLFILNDAISIGLDARDPSVDVPLENVSARRMIFPVPTVWLEQGCEPGMLECRTAMTPRLRQSEGSSSNTRAYQVIGFVNHIIEKRWTLGMYSIVPFSSLLSAHSFFPDEREQYFTNSLHAELYSDRLTPMSLGFGTGLRVFDWLSLGLSFTLNLANDATGSTYVGNAGDLQGTLLLSTEVDSSIGVAPHFAALFEPLDRLDISVTVHTVQKLEINAGAGTFLANGDSQLANRSNVHYWVPLTIGLGATYDLYKSEAHVFALTATAMLKQYSQYLNRQGERALPGYEWADTISGAVGGRYAYRERVATFLDVAYEPTPVPLQTGRTNYVDNDRFALNGGATYTWPIKDWDISFRFGAQAQFHVLRERHQSKIDPRFAPGNQSLVLDEWADDALDRNMQRVPAAQGLQTNNPGWPGFSSSGTLFGGALTAGILY